AFSGVLGTFRLRNAGRFLNEAGLVQCTQELTNASFPQTVSVAASDHSAALRSLAVGQGERDRPGRSVRRLAEQLMRLIPLTVWCARASAAGSSAGRRRKRSRRPRSPSSTASFRLRACLKNG